MSYEYEDHFGRSKRVSVPKIDEKVHDVVLCDRKVKIEKIAKIVGISTGRLYHVLSRMFKLFVRWVSRLLNADQKRDWTWTSSDHFIDI